jgi:hypothetical protein
MVRKRSLNTGSRWELERERFHIDRQDPPVPESVARIGDVVPLVMRQMGLDNAFREHALLSEWGALVGPQVAQHARPGRFERKILTIFVSHPAWLSELSRYGQKEILAKLQARFGADRIRNVRLQLDPDQGRPPKS